MTNHEFINCIRSLYNIDWELLPELSDQDWPKFRDNPPRYLTHTDKTQALAILREMEKRQEKPLLGLRQWQPMDSAPQDRNIIVYAPGRDGLPSMASLCRWHPDAGFCVDEVREPICWTEVPQ